LLPTTPRTSPPRVVLVPFAPPVQVDLLDGVLEVRVRRPPPEGPSDDVTREAAVPGQITCLPWRVVKTYATKADEGGYFPGDVTGTVKTALPGGGRARVAAVVPATAGSTSGKPNPGRRSTARECRTHTPV